MDWKKLISQPAGQEQLQNINTFVTHESISNKSPIDVFYESSQAIIRNTPTTVNKNDWIGCANAVVLVSLTENYFRSILVSILKICTITRKNAASNNINFGSVLWHLSDTIERGAFENTSFSDSKNIIKVTKDFTGADLNNSDLVPILKEFTKVCEMRHGIVHSARYLAGKNALVLDIPSTSDYIKIGIGYAELQSIALICTTLVVSYNQKMFEILCKRWATDWRRTSFWDPQNENNLIKKIWDIFFSTVDSQNNMVTEKGTWIKCRNLIKKEFNLMP